MADFGSADIRIVRLLLVSEGSIVWSGSGDIYTLDGRLMRRNATLQGLPKGIYLMNGKKVAVK